SWTVPRNIPNGSSYAIIVGVVGKMVAFSEDPFTISGGSSSPRHKTATIIVEANPSFGGTSGGIGTFDVGAQQQISATPAQCFIFTGWSDGNTENPRTITVPSRGATYTANFTNVLANAVHPQVDTDGYTMRATFIPKAHDAQGNVVTLSQAATICG